MKNFWIIATLLLLGNMVPAQTSTLCKAGIDKEIALQLYWTEKLGEIYLSNPPKPPDSVVSKLLFKIIITQKFYHQNTAYGLITIVVYDNIYPLCYDNNCEWTILSMFDVQTSKNVTLDHMMIKQAYEDLTITKDLPEPSNQEIEEVICKKINDQ